MTTAQDFITNEREVGLPPLQSSRRAVWNYYQIEFLPNGYPGRRTFGELFAHPIYGPYVIADYTAQYRHTREQTYLDAACRVADAAVAQMTPVRDGLAFLYSQEKTAVSSRKVTFYSGLTQARYIEVLSKLLVLPGTERFREPLSAIVASLRVPTEEGGVARYTDTGGLIIEEYPSLAPDCTLNGWTTATCILRDYAARTKIEEGWDIFSQSVLGLEDLIQAYDVPEWANSRYRLTGVATLRLTAKETDLEIADCQVVIPGSGTFPANVPGDPAGEALPSGSKTVLRDTDESVTLSLSRVTWPSPNRIQIQVDAVEDGLLDVAIGDGKYSPMTNNLPVQFHRELGQFPLQQGKNHIEITVPWADAELVAYPTNFRKRIAGKQFNQYHWIHVDTLGKIVAETGSDKLRYYRDKWERYPTLWPGMAAYQDERITLERFDPKKHK